LDNIYYQNNSRNIVNPYRVNVDDLIQNQFPGGIVRLTQDVEPFQAMRPMEINPLPPHMFALMEQSLGWMENKTGVTRYNQGLDAESLNKTATGISQVMAASQQRIELIARCFAETGVKDLFHNLAEMNINFLDIPTAVRINNAWRTIDPAEIDVDFRVIIDVGIGTGTKDMLIQQMIQIINMTAPMMQIGVVTPENVYNQMRTLMETMGYKNVDAYITKPQPQMPQPQPVPGGQNAGQSQGPGTLPPGVEGAGFPVGGGTQAPGPPANMQVF
jgi:hypothetical protein